MHALMLLDASPFPEHSMMEEPEEGGVEEPTEDQGKAYIQLLFENVDSAVVPAGNEQDEEGHKDTPGIVKRPVLYE